MNMKQLSVVLEIGGETQVRQAFLRSAAFCYVREVDCRVGDCFCRFHEVDSLVRNYHCLA